ncbi:hypothetical protein SODALDRAFT_277537 [Sodiomyces alkalinus F11]|uniref:Mis12 domain-containing protein n=1 Tax=Sodiomyces alkalinus (strain CBS 110278 / VKM F-3762 / F11) TaxID=1314773 RepID=A0A3N2PWI4_SODAK|nr:hypothetical protein SODALDRAFT_277537 [Sodiomyces alkalinus F11]ROT38857.1 hypothetical protein SODALDRAFT_277537 [Sodiomyces alkalinus F11]
MAGTQPPDTVLLTEHLGYAPVSLLDSIINVVNSLADRTLDRVEQGLAGATPKTLGFERALKKRHQQQQGQSSGAPHPLPLSPQEAAEFEVADGVHKLETLLCNAIDKNFDIFELYVMKYLICVNASTRSWIRLAHYNDLAFDALHRDESPSTESVNAVRRSLQESQRLNGMLYVEKARNAELLAKLRVSVGDQLSTSMRSSVIKSDTKRETVENKGPFGFLHDNGDLAEADAQTPITTTSAFTLSQMQALRALSTSLSNLIPGLEGDSDASEARDQPRRGWRRERMEYVQGATRKHLESVWGLELADNGLVRDGDWQGRGRKFAKGEVEGLEKSLAVIEHHKETPSAQQDDSSDP